MNHLMFNIRLTMQQITIFLLFLSVSWMELLGNFVSISFQNVDLFFSSGGHMREFTDEESNFAALLQRAMDLEGVDRDVVYQLVALLMKVMSSDELP